MHRAFYPTPPRASLCAAVPPPAAHFTAHGPAALSLSPPARSTILPTFPHFAPLFTVRRPHTRIPLDFSHHTYIPIHPHPPTHLPTHTYPPTRSQLLHPIDHEWVDPGNLRVLNTRLAEWSGKFILADVVEETLLGAARREPGNRFLGLRFRF